MGSRSLWALGFVPGRGSAMVQKETQELTKSAGTNVWTMRKYMHRRAVNKAGRFWYDIVWSYLVHKLPQSSIAGGCSERGVRPTLNTLSYMNETRAGIIGHNTLCGLLFTINITTSLADNTCSSNAMWQDNPRIMDLNVQRVRPKLQYSHRPNLQQEMHNGVWVMLRAPRKDRILCLLCDAWNSFKRPKVNRERRTCRRLIMLNHCPAGHLAPTPPHVGSW